MEDVDFNITLNELPRIVFVSDETVEEEVVTANDKNESSIEKKGKKQTPSSSKTLQCNTCGKKYKKKKYLDTHVKSCNKFCVVFIANFSERYESIIFV